MKKGTVTITVLYSTIIILSLLPILTTGSTKNFGEAFKVYRRGQEKSGHDVIEDQQHPQGWMLPKFGPSRSCDDNDIIVMASTSSTASSSSSTEDAFPISRSILRRRYVMSLRRKQREKKSHKLATHKKNKSVSLPGTKFTFSKPTPDKVDTWFSSWDVSKALYYGMNPIQFNHGCVGMTNPCLRIIDCSSSSSNNDDSSSSAVLAVSNRQQQYHPKQNKASSSSSIMNTAISVEDEWWPSTSFDHSSSSSSASSSWRVIRIRCRVGIGKECYQKVRDALLDWQFDTTSNGKEQGIIRIRPTVQQPQPKGGRRPRRRPYLYQRRSNYDVLPQQEDEDDHWSSNNKKKLTSPFNERVSTNIQQIWSGPHMGQRLVTYTGTSGPKWLPKLYAINPVMVIYDLVDQRGQGTTYTSTAYATLRGHLLSGEERATVAIRDGSNTTEEYVDVEILSFSRPSPTIQGRLIWPIIGTMQKQFFLNQMDIFKKVAASASAATEEQETKKNNLLLHHHSFNS